MVYIGLGLDSTGLEPRARIIIPVKYLNTLGNLDLELHVP